MLRGLWIYSVVGGKFHAAEALGQQLLALAQEAQDTGHLLEAHRTLAATLFYLGECTAAYMHAQQGLALYDPQQHHVLAFHYGQDPGVVCLIYAAWQLWYLGYPDQALVRSQEGLALAQRLSHPHSLALALNTAATLHQFRGAARATQSAPRRRWGWRPSMRLRSTRRVAPYSRAGPWRYRGTERKGLRRCARG